MTGVIFTDGMTSNGVLVSKGYRTALCGFVEKVAREDIRGWMLRLAANVKMGMAVAIEDVIGIVYAVPEDGLTSRQMEIKEAVEKYIGDRNIQRLRQIADDARKSAKGE